MTTRKWVKLPTRWIVDGGLVNLSWQASIGANKIAALMALIAIAHNADEEHGIARLTYDDLEQITDLSRAKLAAGLNILEEQNLIEREPQGRSTFKLIAYDPESGYAKLPNQGLYAGSTIRAFREFKLRKRIELDALQLYFLIIAFRDRRSNLARISYDKIEEYTGISRVFIKSAISFLAANDLIYVEHVPSSVSEHGISNAYRPRYIDSHIHMGTKGRSPDIFEYS